MTTVRRRTLVHITITVVAAVVLVTILMPRWRSWTKQSSIEPSSNVNRQADREEIWRAPNQAGKKTTPQKIAPPGPGGSQLSINKKNQPEFKMFRPPEKTKVQDNDKEKDGNRDVRVFARRHEDGGGEQDSKELPPSKGDWTPPRARPGNHDPQTDRGPLDRNINPYPGGPMNAGNGSPQVNESPQLDKGPSDRNTNPQRGGLMNVDNEDSRVNGGQSDRNMNPQLGGPMNVDIKDPNTGKSWVLDKPREEGSKSTEANESLNNAQKYQHLKKLIGQLTAKQNSNSSTGKYGEGDVTKGSDTIKTLKQGINHMLSRMASKDGTKQRPDEEGGERVEERRARPNTGSTNQRVRVSPKRIPQITPRSGGAGERGNNPLDDAKVRRKPIKPPTTSNLPFITIRKGMEIRPERLSPPENSSDIYYSVLTAPPFHNTRFSFQYLTWLQAVNPEQVNVITDKDDNEWIQAIKKEGGNIHLPRCPLSSKKTREMMCCKTGAQFEYWYKAREAGKDYKWYCHFDDDLYVNPQAIVNMLRTYDPSTDRYIGAWNCVAKTHNKNRIPAKMLAPGLLKFTERKRDDFRYANGPSYCISYVLMNKVEKYLRGKNFEETCRRSDVIMDDVLPGVVIDGILGIDMNVTDEFMSQMDKTQLTFDSTAKETKKIVEKILTIGFGKFGVNNGRFSQDDDTNGVLSYHCLIHPEVSWCHK